TTLFGGGVERPAPFHDLPVALFGTEVNRCPYGRCAHVVRHFHCREEHLVELVWVGQQFVVIQLHDEGDFVCVLARDGTQDTTRRSHCVASTFDSQLYDVFR